MMNEAQLLQAYFEDGDESAFTSIVERHGARLWICIAADQQLEENFTAIDVRKCAFDYGNR
jgi:hypothetical protein